MALCCAVLISGRSGQAHDLSFDTAAADVDPSQVYLALRWVKTTPFGPSGSLISRREVQAKHAAQRKTRNQEPGVTNR